MYKHTARCPVCRAIFDTLTMPTKQVHAQGAALLLQEPRGIHAKNSPKCREYPEWIKGWVFDKPVLIEEE